MLGLGLGWGMNEKGGEGGCAKSLRGWEGMGVHLGGEGVPDRDAVAPPQLAADAPVPNPL